VSRAALVALLLLAGCKLVDQTTFNPEAGKRPTIPPLPAPVKPVANDPAALITIRFPATADPAADVAKAVAAARARKADVVFDVVEVTASGGGGSVGADADTVARLITAQSVPPGRVHLLVRPDPAASGREVRVYVH